MLGVQGGAASRVRGNDRSLADFIGHRQFRPQLPGLTGDVGAILACSDRLAQFTDALFQTGLFRFGRHGGNQALHRLDELKLLAVFGFVDGLACLHRLRVVRANVIEQMQRLRCAFHRVGQQIETAQGEHRRYQPGQETGRGNHERISIGNTK
ncbi:hypothetical protein D3C76_1010960 [compost metagenome]